MTQQDRDEVRTWIKEQRIASCQRHSRGDRDPEALVVSSELHAKLLVYRKETDELLGGDLLDYDGEMRFRRLPVLPSEEEADRPTYAGPPPP